MKKHKHLEDNLILIESDRPPIYGTDGINWDVFKNTPKGMVHISLEDWKEGGYNMYHLREFDCPKLNCPVASNSLVDIRS